MPPEWGREGSDRLYEKLSPLTDRYFIQHILCEVLAEGLKRPSTHSKASFNPPFTPAASPAVVHLERAHADAAPFHHHLEASGWPETQIVMRLWVVAFVAAGLGVALALLDALI